MRVLSPGKYGGIFLEDTVKTRSGAVTRRVRNSWEVSRSDNFMMNNLVGKALEHFNWGAAVEPVPKKRNRVEYRSAECKPAFVRAERETVAHPARRGERMVEISFFLS